MLAHWVWTLAALTLPAFGAGPAEAQDCGSWYRPVVCQAELVMTGSDYRPVALGERSRVELGPRARVDFEVDARDQGGRRFPTERLAVELDAEACRSLLAVEETGPGRYRVTASASAGRCTLQVFLPNNLNFHWEVDVEINAAARAGYDRAEAETVVNALYLAILDREPDSNGFRSAVQEVQSGNVDSLIDSMSRSAEARDDRAGLTEAELLDRYYRGFFDRPVDAGGIRVYSAEMRRGEHAAVLRKLLRSPEFEQRLQR